MDRRSTFRRKAAAILLAALIAASVTMSGCSDNSGTSEGKEKSRVTVSESKPAVSNVSIDADDTDAAYSESDSTSIVFSDGAVSAQGNGIKTDGGTATITEGGTFILSGSSNDGRIVIEADKNAVVRLVMDNLTLKSTSSSAIYAPRCLKTIIIAKDGTENNISDSGSYSESTESSSDSDEPNATILVKDDLTILGGGTLNVTGNSNNGITSKDTLRITGGSISVTAAHHGITGKDNLHISGGTITVDAKNGDALRSTNDDAGDTEKGNVFIESADISIISGNDGIQAEKDLTISSGNVSIVTGGGADSNKSAGGNDFGMNFGGRQMGKQENQTSTDTSESSESRKGLKAGSSVLLAGGKINVDSYDDSVHSNGSVDVTGGEYELKSGDDGIHAESSLTISDGNIIISKSYEGLEAEKITLAGGTTDITSSDDGINCAGGNDSSGFGGMDFGMKGGNSPFGTDSDASLVISGGNLYVNAQGDGLDSNGSVDISGGTIVVNGTTSGGNGILDHGGAMNVSGGTIIGSGTSDMLEMPDSTSTQKTMVILFGSNQPAGTLVWISDSSGNILTAMAPEKSFACLVFSSPSLKNGEKYSVYTGGTATGESLHGYYKKAAVSGGTLFTEFELSDAVTYADSNGVTTYSGGMGGRGGQGGFGRGKFNSQDGQSMPDFGNGEMPQMPDGQTPPDFQDGQFPQRGRFSNQESSGSV